MAIKFKHGGRDWEADTPAEAIALREQLEFRDERALQNSEDLDWKTDPVWTPDRIEELLKGLGQQQTKFVMLLYAHSSVTSNDARDYMRLESETALAGVVSGLSKQLLKLKLKPEDLYSVSVRWSGKDKTRTFRLSANFRWIAEAELGWPEGLPPEAARLRNLVLDHETLKAVRHAASLKFPGSKLALPGKAKPQDTA